MIGAIRRDFSRWLGNVDFEPVGDQCGADHQQEAELPHDDGGFFSLKLATGPEAASMTMIAMTAMYMLARWSSVKKEEAALWGRCGKGYRQSVLLVGRR